MITLSLWVTESVAWLSTPKIGRSHSVEHKSHMTAVHTQNNISETGEGYSPEIRTGGEKRRSATSFARVAGL